MSWCAYSMRLGGGDASFESFANWLEARMEGPTLLMREVGGVVLAPIRSLSGLRFDSVFVGGLVEGEFPAPRVTTALLNDNALEALANSGLELPRNQAFLKTSSGPRPAPPTVRSICGRPALTVAVVRRPGPTTTTC